MQDRRYLLFLKEKLLEEELQLEEQLENQLEEQSEMQISQAAQMDELLKVGALKLDSERLRKFENIKHKKSKLESLGAGLLLQLAVQETFSKTEETGITLLTFPQLLERVKEPLPLEYTYNQHGKPYLKNYPFYFNISHSGDCVFCVLSKQEVGVDIQCKTPQIRERMVKRIFSLEERAYWERCATEEEKRDFFFQMWCRKEAYGKLTGRGLADAVGVNMYWLELPVYIEEYSLEENEYLEGYQIAICKWK